MADQGLMTTAAKTFANTLDRWGLPELKGAALGYVIEHGIENQDDLMAWVQTQDSFKSKFPNGIADVYKFTNPGNDLTSQLKSWGLESLQTAFEQYVVENGTDDTNSMMLWLYERPEFEKRFPALKELSAKGQAISPADYVAKEQAYTSVLRQYPIASKFFDDPAKDFHNLIASGVSPQELNDRMENGYKRVTTADPKVREAFKEYFGVKGDDALAAYFIDPEKSKTTIVQQAQEAEIGAAAKMTFGKLDLSYASNLAQKGIGFDQALAGFQKMQASKGLFEANMSEANIGNPEMHFMTDLNAPKPGQSQAPSLDIAASNTASLAADYAFGVNTNNQEALRLRLAQRKAEFEGQAQNVGTNKAGETNIGSAF
jgi:hypothetical protein